MKKSKKFLSVLLAVLMFISIMPMSDIAIVASALETSGQCGNNVYWSFDESTGELVISGEGDMKNYSWYTDGTSPFYKLRENIKSITINEGVTSIGSYAFQHLKNLTNITIPDSVTKIGERAFYYCTNLSQVTLPNSVREIGRAAFQGCTSLTSIVVPDGVENLIYAFMECEKLESAVLPDSVTDIEGTFSGCISLKEIAIPKNVTHIGSDAFYNCKSLKSITIPENVVYIDNYVFWKCTSLETINILGTVELRRAVFDNTAYYNNDANWENDVLYIGKHLIKAKDTISGEYEIKPGTTTIAGEAFEYCSQLTSVTMPDSVMYLGEEAFYECTNLSYVNLSEKITKIGDSTFYWCTNLKDITIPSAVTSIDDWAFGSCDSLEYIELPESLKYLGFGAFSNCDNLENIILPDSSVDIRDYAFDYTPCWYQNWQDNMLYIGKHLIKASEVIDLDEEAAAPWSCVIKDGTLTIAECAFQDCTALIAVEIPDSLISIGYRAFEGCTGIEDLVIPNNVETLNDYAFNYCSSLSSITIPNSVTEIGFFAFDGCVSLTDVYYTGTESEWNQISIDETENGNDYLLNATIHFLDSTCTHENKIEYAKQDATCTTSGYTAGVYCPDCKEWLSGHDVIEAPGHSPVTSTKEASCTENGYKITVCNSCKEEIGYEVITAGGHSFSNWTETKKVTCTVDGQESRKCSKCGETETRTVVTSGHKWSEWNVTEATLISAGEKTRSCSACGENETVILPMLEGVVNVDYITGVTAEYADGTYDGKLIQMFVSEDTLGRYFLENTYGKYDNVVSWDIRFFVDDERAQPEKPVLVTIPIPSGFNKDAIVIYHVSLTGEFEVIEPVTIGDNYVTFFADSFSIYMVVDESSIIEEDPAENCSCNCHKSGFMGFIWKIANFFNKLFKTKAICACGARHY